MGWDLYRDVNVGIRARLAELEARIKERESEVTEAFWASLEDEVHERMLAERDALELVASGASLEELARAETMLASYLEELERLIAQLPDVEEEWHELPDDVTCPPPRRRDNRGYSRLASNQWLAVRRSLVTMVRERDRDASITTDGVQNCVARFRERGCPFALRAAAYLTGGVTEAAFWLVTSVPRAMPRLVVRHETLLLSVAKALGLRREVEVGDPSFDGLFLIRGARDAAVRLLPTQVRTQLLALSRFDVPTLEIDPPARTASLRWRFEPAAKALDAAVRVLAAIREMPADVRFRT